MAVLRPLKVVITNFGENETRTIEAPLHPEDPSLNTRRVPFSNVLYIERDDFREDPPKDWFRLAPGREVRLRYAPLLRCNEVIKDANGEVTELRCTIDPETWTSNPADGRVVRGTLHWVSAAHAIPAEVRLYDRLFLTENPGTTEGKSFLEEINPQSLVKIERAFAEPHLATAQAGNRYQFERLGYFCVDADSVKEKLVWNRTVTLKDTWAKIEAKASGKTPQAPKAKDSKDAKSKEAPIQAAAGPLPIGPEIGIEEFAKLDLRVAIVRAADTVEEAKKLIRLEVDLGEGRTRQIFAGLRAYYPDPKVLVGQRVIVVANLKPRQMKFGVSEGMVLAAGGGDRPHRAVSADDSAQPGDKVQ